MEPTGGGTECTAVRSGLQRPSVDARSHPRLRHRDVRHIVFSRTHVQGAQAGRNVCLASPAPPLQHKRR